MRKFATTTLAAAAALGLAACGSADDASEEAIADTVEMPADDAMVDTPLPVADPDALSDTDQDAGADAVDAQADAADAEAAADAAEQAAADAAAAAEAATQAAEDGM